MEYVLSQADNGSTIDVHQGDVLQLELIEQASGGYLWSLDALNTSLLTEVETGVRPPATSRIGDTATRFWRLHANAAGIAQLSAVRLRPWEGEASIVARFSCTVSIAE